MRKIDWTTQVLRLVFILQNSIQISSNTVAREEVDTEDLVPMIVSALQFAALYIRNWSHQSFI